MNCVSANNLCPVGQSWKPESKQNLGHCFNSDKMYSVRSPIDFQSPAISSNNKQCFASGFGNHDNNLLGNHFGQENLNPAPSMYPSPGQGMVDMSSCQFESQNYPGVNPSTGGLYTCDPRIEQVIPDPSGCGFWPPDHYCMEIPGGKRKRKRVITMEQRRAANVRERKRMFQLNEAFDKLRKRVPTFAYEKKLSRIETLRLAVTYIEFMSEVVENNGEETKGKEARKEAKEAESADRRELLQSAGESMDEEDSDSVSMTSSTTSPS